MRNRVAATASAVGMALTALVVAAPAASASGCGYSTGVYTQSDYAYASDYDNSCGTIAIRHRYSPVWTGNSYWTGWASTTGTWVRSTTAAEILYADGNSY